MAIVEELGDRRGMADSYLQLADVARQRGKQDEALDWYRQAMAIFEEQGNARA